MRILIFFSIVALGKATELFSTSSKHSETLNGYQPLSVSSFSGNSDFNTHSSSNFNSGLNSESFSEIPVSSTIQGESLNTHLPVFNRGLNSADSSVTGTGFISSSRSYSSGQHQDVQPLFVGSKTGSPNGFFGHVLPNSIQYHAVSSTSSPTSYVNPTSLPGSFSLASVPVQGQDSSFKSGSKTVEIISDEGDDKAVTSNGSPFNGQNSLIIANNSAASSSTAQKTFSSNFANEKSDTVLASRFLSIKDQNDDLPSQAKLTSNYDTIVTTDPTTTAKPLSSTPTASPTPYTVTVTPPTPTTAFPKTNFETVTTSYPSTTFKTYSTPLYNNYNSIYSTPKPLKTYSKVFSTAAPITTPVSTTPTPAYFAPNTFKTYSTPLYINYNSIYSTPKPFNTYSKVFSTAAPVTTPVPTTPTPAYWAPNTFKTYSTPLYNNYNPIYSTPKPLNTYSRIFSTAVPVTTPVSTTKTQTYFAPTTFKSYSTPFYNNFNSFYSTPAPLNTYSRVFSTPVPTSSSTIKSSSVSNGASETINNIFKPTQYVPSVVKNMPNTFTSSVTTQSPSDLTSFDPNLTSNNLSSRFSKPYSSAEQSSSHFSISSTPAPFNTTSPSFPIFTASAPTASPTPYSVSVTTPFPELKFKTVSSYPYSSTTFKPYSSSSPVPYSFNTIYSTPKTFNSYPKVFSTPVSGVSDATSFNPPTSKYVSNIFSKPYTADAKSSLYSNVFPSPNTPSSPSFPVLASAAPISTTPYSVAVTTPAPTSAFWKENFKTVTPTPYFSTSFKPFSTTALPYSIYSTPKTFNSYFNTLSTTAPAVSNSFKFSSASNGVSKSLNSGKSSEVTASQSLKPNVDLTSRFDPVHSPLSHASVSTTPRPFGAYSITYPESGTIHGSSFNFNSEPVISQTSYPVVYPYSNINSGVYNAPASGQHSYYSGNLSPTFKVSENTLYSPPVPISFSSLSSKSEFYPVPAQLSYPSVYSSTYGKNVGLTSVYDVHSTVPFGYSVQQAPLTKEYHTVEKPVVRTWKSIDSWNVAPVSHFQTDFS